jgi:catechol 2,3-dioxygenase-like lactoylglutathione lyase family enzyme
MPVQLNHTIALATDPEASAALLSEMLGLGTPRRYGPFHEVQLDNGVTIDFLDSGGQPILGIHYAFLVTEAEFDEIFGRIQERGIEHYADPHKHQPGEINTNDGGRGVYWDHPDGHFLEILTVPYGGWPTD